MAKTVLALVAHPDDESFWMGGKLAELAATGRRVVVAVAADGLEGRTVPRGQQFLNACKVLGVAGGTFNIFPDQQADTVPQLQINQWAEWMVQKESPSVVLTHYHGDLNIDHRRVCEAALVATRDVCPVWMCEPEYVDRVVGSPFDPWPGGWILPTIQDIKWRACQCYPEELAAKPKTRSRERLMVERFVEVR